MANKIYYSTITYQSILRNDNWKQGGNASTFMADTKDGKPLKMEVNQYGKTKKEAEENERRRMFLTSKNLVASAILRDFYTGRF